MAYRCKNCGRIVGKGTVHKYLHANLPPGKCHVMPSPKHGGKGYSGGRLQNQRVRLISGRR